MFEHMTDQWVSLHRRAAELLHAIVLWHPSVTSTAWQTICPHAARLTKVLVVADVLADGGSIPTEGVWRRELAESAAAAASACTRAGLDFGPERRVAAAAERLLAVAQACAPAAAEAVARAS